MKKIDKKEIATAASVIAIIGTDILVSRVLKTYVPGINKFGITGLLMRFSASMIGLTVASVVGKHTYKEFDELIKAVQNTLVSTEEVQDKVEEATA